VLPERKRKEVTKSQLDGALVHLQDLDPNVVTFREKSQLLTPEERWNLNFRNTTLKRLVRMLGEEDVAPDAVIRYILDRKHELHDYFQGENSFYVCRISQGNMFAGEAPGALQVIPGTRPTVNLDEIFGDGYTEIRNHADHIESTTKWHDLFVATSPSKTADKSNVLMVGPMGCGKSEVLRGVGAQRGSVGIFAVGSDFNTCWAGEAQKNPKRLFEAAVKLEKESRKHVHILIDEIDSVLNDDQHSGRTNFNLRLEFQILMDGVVNYPRITLWGATNNIDRIPMPMIRRFSKVVIVGELDQEDRVRALQHFSSYLPIKDYPDEAWQRQGRRLAGATGDVIRKVVDHVWREKMTHFVDKHPTQAEALVRFLNAKEKFTVGEFSAERRAKFRKQLGKHVVLTPEEMDRSIELALDNVGIHHEIETAVATYDAARKFLARIRAERAA
jgi:AAA+ superfamily predicted ATPase